MTTTLSQVEKEIASIISDLTTNPKSMTIPILRQLQGLYGKRKALDWMESIPADQRGKAARESIANLTSHPIRDGEELSTMGELAIYGQYANKP